MSTVYLYPHGYRISYTLTILPGSFQSDRDFWSVLYPYKIILQEIILFITHVEGNPWNIQIRATEGYGRPYTPVSPFKDVYGYK